MKYALLYHKAVQKEDIPKLDMEMKKRIRSAIEEKLTVEPEKFGKPLRRALKNYRKLRVGEYRVVFRIEKNTVKILAILHRSIVYKEMEGRL